MRDAMFENIHETIDFSFQYFVLNELRENNDWKCSCYIIICYT